MRHAVGRVVMAVETAVKNILGLGDAAVLESRRMTRVIGKVDGASS